MSPTLILIELDVYTILPSPSSEILPLNEVILKLEGRICSPNSVVGIDITPIWLFEPVGMYLDEVKVDCK